MIIVFKVTSSGLAKTVPLRGGLEHHRNCTQHADDNIILLCRQHHDAPGYTHYRSVTVRATRDNDKEMYQSSAYVAVVDACLFGPGVGCDGGVHVGMHGARTRPRVILVSQSCQSCDILRP